MCARVSRQMRQLIGGTSEQLAGMREQQQQYVRKWQWNVQWRHGDVRLVSNVWDVFAVSVVFLSKAKFACFICNEANKYHVHGYTCRQVHMRSESLPLGRAFCSKCLCHSATSLSPSIMRFIVFAEGTNVWLCR